MKILEMLHAEFDLTGSEFTFGLDNTEARKAVMAEFEPSIKKPDYDMIHEIRSRMKKLPIVFHSKWIKGHQDRDNHDYSKMDIWTLLNIEMDHLAAEHMARHSHEDQPNIPLPHERITIWIDSAKLAHFDKHELYEKVYGRTGTDENDKRTWTSRKFWQTREQLTDEAMDNIHWKALGKAIRKAPQGTQRWILKQATGQCGVGRMLLRRKYNDHGRCPRCGEEDETTKHVLRCKDPRSTSQWRTGLTKLNHWMTRADTQPILQAAIIQRLKEWQENKPKGRIFAGNEITQAIERQDEIGWWSFLLGRVDTSFETIMATHYARIKSKKKPHPWTTNLIHQIWEVQWRLWEHRNNIEHNHMTPAKQQQLDNLIVKAQDEFQQGHVDLLPSDRYLFAEAEFTLNLSLPELETWLLDVRHARNAVDAERIRKRDEVARSQEVMQAWLATAQDR